MTVCVFLSASRILLNILIKVGCHFNNYLELVTIRAQITPAVESVSQIGLSENKLRHFPFHSVKTFKVARGAYVAA